MRFGALTVSVAASVAFLLAAGQPATQAQTGDPVRLAEQKAAPKKKEPAKKTESKKGAQPTSGAYAGMPVARRAAIQFDLNWTNHYTGPADGEFSERSVAAVKAFQKDRGFRETGTLTDAEREALATSAQNRRERVGWRMVEDRATGAQVGLPANLAKHESAIRSGTRWQMAQGQFQIETFRVREPGATLATVFEDQKKEPPNRRISTSALRNSSFVMTGTQGLKNFLMRAEVRDLEIRGITVLYARRLRPPPTTSHSRCSARSRRSPAPA